MNHKGKTSRQKGNALWFVLIVVALFGALAATLSRNTGTVNQAGDVEQNRVKAAAILRYGTAIQTAVQKMMLSGISENALSFEGISEDFENTTCTDDSCEVFNVEGGGIPYRALRSVIGEDMQEDWFISAQNFVYLAGCDDEDEGCTDLMIIAPDIPESVCLQVNAVQEITNTDGAPPQIETLLLDEPFDGTFSPAVNTYTLGGTGTNEAPEVQGKNAACIEANNIYYFYQLLIAR